jgi:erythromycin esterase-like protein
MKEIVPFVIFLLLSITARSQTLADRYDSHFLKRDGCTWEWESRCLRCEFLFDTIPNPSEPRVLKISYKVMGYFLRNMYTMLARQIQLPFGEYKKLSLSLIYKSQSVKGFRMNVTGIDSDESILYSRIFDITGSDRWETFSSQLPGKNVRAIKVQIFYDGTNDKDQALWLQSISVKLDGKDINNMAAAYQPPVDSARLTPSRIVPLSPVDNFQMVDRVTDIMEAKVIGLGENTHGSRSIRAAGIQFVKNMVSNHNCKLILLEHPSGIGLMEDLFVQGLVPLDWPELDGYLKMGSGDYLQKREFLIWLRQYNLNATAKVHVCGIDDSGPLITNYLMEYYRALLGPTKSKPFIKLLFKDDYNELFKLSENDSDMKMLIGDQAFAWHQYLLFNKYRDPRAGPPMMRDSSMYLRYLFLDSVFTGANEKIAVMAHAVHLKRIPEINFNGYSEVLGSLLSKHLGKNYFAIGFLFGNGYFTQDSCSITVETNIVIDSLRNVPPNSFEYAAQQTGLDYFYYPSAFINRFIESMAIILRFGRGESPFVFSSLKRRFDGYVFSRRSESPKHYAEKPSITTPQFLFERRDTFYVLINRNDSIPVKIKMW